jgi:hypothetical protein
LLKRAIAGPAASGPAAVFDHGHLAKRIHAQKLGFLLRASHEIHVDGSKRHFQQRQEELHAMRVTGQRVTMDDDFAHFRGSSSGRAHYSAATTASAS